VIARVILWVWLMIAGFAGIANPATAILLLAKGNISGCLEFGLFSIISWAALRATWRDIGPRWRQKLLANKASRLAPTSGRGLLSFRMFNLRNLSDGGGTEPCCALAPFRLWRDLLNPHLIADLSRPGQRLGLVFVGLGPPMRLVGHFFASGSSSFAAVSAICNAAAVS